MESSAAKQKGLKTGLFRIQGYCIVSCQEGLTGSVIVIYKLSVLSNYGNQSSTYINITSSDALFINQMLLKGHYKFSLQIL